MKENAYQAALIKRLKKEFEGAIILKNDAQYLQGIPDLVIFYGKNYAFLEVKESATAKHRPNQDYWVDRIGDMSYAAFIYPENEDQVIEELKELFN